MDLSRIRFSQETDGGGHSGSREMKVYERKSL